MISGFNIGVENISRSHLQLLDDTLILLDGYEKSLTNLKHLIDSFELVSGLKVKWSKRFLIGVVVVKGFAQNLLI